jgi:hypothetical protein
MAAPAESMRTGDTDAGDTDAWSTSTKRNSSPTDVPSYYTSFINVKGLFNASKISSAHDVDLCAVDETESDASFKEATAVAVRLVTLEDLRKANVGVDVEAKGEDTTSMLDTWTPNKNEWLIMISLAFISLMVALDASILVTVLPVSHL